MRQSVLLTFAFAGLSGLGLAGCGSSGGGSTGPGGGGSGPITQAQAGASAGLAQTYSTNAMSSFRNGGYAVSGLPSFVASAVGARPEVQTALATALYAAGVRGLALGTAGAPPLLYRSGSNCAPVLSGALTAGHPTDSDGDGIPDSVIATFTAGNCSVFDSASSTTFTFSGTMKVVDIGTVYGFRLVLDLVYTLSSPSESSHFVFSGSETLNISSTVADLLVSLNLNDTTTTSGHTALVIVQDGLHFVFTSGGSSIVWNQPLPDGTLGMTGHLGFNFPGQTSTYAFDLTTPVLLAYSASCDAAGYAPPYTAGHLTGMFSGGVSAGFDVTFTGCNTAATVTTFGTTG